MAMASKASVVPTFILIKGKTHKIIIGKELVVNNTGNRILDQVENTARFTKVIEDFARGCPEQWFWLHQRWKSRPDNDPNKGTEKAAIIQP